HHRGPARRPPPGRRRRAGCEARRGRGRLRHSGRRVPGRGNGRGGMSRPARGRGWLRREGPPAPPSPPPSPPSADPATVAAKAALLRRLELDVTRRLDGMLSGDYLAFATGPGSEPAGARPYSPGDDARRIDWSL